MQLNPEFQPYVDATERFDVGLLRQTNVANSETVCDRNSVLDKQLDSYFEVALFFQEKLNKNLFYHQKKRTFSFGLMSRELIVPMSLFFFGALNALALVLLVSLWGFGQEIVQNSMVVLLFNSVAFTTVGGAVARVRVGGIQEWARKAITNR